jgi:hypothetical protein
MNWDALGATAELVAAAGVIASLIYLATQIRQSNATDKLNATLSIQASYNQVGDLFLRDVAIVSEGLEDLSKLDSEGQLAFTVIFHLFFGHVELVHSYDKKGMLDRNTLNRAYGSLRMYSQFLGVRQWWAAVGSQTFSDEFVLFVESNGMKAPDAT